MASISWFCGVHVRPTLCNFIPSQAEKGPTFPSPINSIFMLFNISDHLAQVFVQGLRFLYLWSITKPSHVYCKNSSIPFCFSIPIISNLSSCTNNMVFISVFVLSVLPLKKEVGLTGGNFFCTPQWQYLHL